MPEHLLASSLLAALCVLAMGFAIQRGGTCTVAAVDEWVNQRRVKRLMALLEASLWVAGGLALARLAQWAGSMPPDHAATAWTVIGGVLLGLGAWLNGACVFGTVARLGNGDWAYAITPLGFMVGCLSVMTVFAQPTSPIPAADTSWLQAAHVAGPLFVLYALWRITPPLLALRRPGGLAALRQRVWAPHAATIVIGVCFVVTLLVAGRWAYTDVLAALADAMRRGSLQLTLPLLLLVALFGGAMLGGWTAGRWQPTPPRAAQLLKCLAGGALMGWGSLLIPGSNDGLLLIGIPLLRPHAWLAVASMVIAIVIALTAQQRWARRGTGG